MAIAMANRNMLTKEVLSVVGIADSVCEGFDKTNVASTTSVYTASGEIASSYATSYSYFIGNMYLYIKKLNRTQLG
ncbi:unnamed protein product [Fusarium venenatum]|uniref:Uncharacterized protein n=1 Tax=Fusarium venenatum TaxID=56646 RepID=A0A2L2T5Q9_9HYPO|nr:uncharacterized protein FVRRES_04817 [Fusarium venenatum]CEI60381.1 unnamed protein product [Fusarium venenatum]